MPKQTGKSRRGRPSKIPVEGERNSLGLRVTAQLKAKLEEAAAASGRSQSQEAEFRLERSFMVNEGRYLEFGGKDTYQFCAMLAQMADMMTLTKGKRWKDDSGWFLYVVGAWTEMVKLRAGEGFGPDLPTELDDFAKFVLHNFDKGSSEELQQLGASAFKVAQMRSKEIEKK